MTFLEIFDTALADLDSSRITPIGQGPVFSFTSSVLDICLHNAAVKLQQLRRDPQNPDLWKDLGAYSRIATMLLDESEPSKIE